MQVANFIFNPFSENTYLLYEEGGECWVVDPGYYGPEEGADLLKFIEGKKLRYAMEIFVPVLPTRVRVRCQKSLERLQKTLGECTDHASAADRHGSRCRGSLQRGPGRRGRRRVPRHPRRRLVRADGIGVLAVERIDHDDLEQHRKGDKNHSGVLPIPVQQTKGQRAEKIAVGHIGIGFGRERHRRAVGPPPRGTTRRHHHAQSGDKGRNFGIGDQQAIDQACKNTDQEKENGWI